MASYDPKKGNLIVNGVLISGFSEGAIEVAYADEDDVKETVGIMGEHSFTENNNTSGLITFRLKNTSPYNAVMDTLRKLKIEFPIIFKQTSGTPFTATCDLARIKNRPGKTFEAEESETEWIVACGNLVTVEA